MTSERLLNMHIEGLYLRKKIYTPRTNFWLRPCRFSVIGLYSFNVQTNFSSVYYVLPDEWIFMNSMPEPIGIGLRL